MKYQIASNEDLKKATIVGVALPDSLLSTFLHLHQPITQNRPLFLSLHIKVTEFPTTVGCHGTYVVYLFHGFFNI